MPTVGSLRFVWDAVAGATSDNLYWSAVAPLTKQSAKLIAGVVSPYLHTGLTNGKPIYYAVTARNSAGESDLSSVVGATPVPPVPIPAAPQAVKVTPGDQANTLNWEPVDKAYYNLYASTTKGFVAGAATKLNAVVLASASYTHSGLTNGTTYYYVVTAKDTNNNESGYSTEASATPQDATPPANPTGLSAVAGDKIDEVFIGSCMTNIGHYRAASKVLEDAMVVLFEEDTPKNLIALLKPDVLVKGADYKVDQVIGREIVESHGGRVHLVEILEGYSTTHIARKVRQSGQTESANKN